MSDSPPLRISEPGIYEISHEAYHADPCEVPSFSRSIAKLLIQASPAHARCVHPRLGAQEDVAEDEGPEAPVAQAIEARDVGTAAHAAFLQGEDVVVLVPFNDYRTAAAKAARDEAIRAGKVPLKKPKYDQMLGLLEALENYRAKTGAFTRGKPERTLIWREGPTWCRCRPDWLPDDPSEPLWDLKTTPGRTAVETWTRRCFDQGSHLQPVFYSRGCAELRDGEVPNGFYFVVVETNPPYGIRRFELSPQAFGIAAEQLDYAMRLWERCQAENFWPGYDDAAEWIDPPSWVLRQWEWSSRTAQGVQRLIGRPDPSIADRIVQQQNWGG